MPGSNFAKWEREWIDRIGFPKDGYSVKAVDRVLSRPFVTPSTLVVDVGGSVGVDAGPLAKLANFVIVLDIDKTRLHVGKVQSDDAGIRVHIDFVMASGEYLPFRDITFGLVTCFSVLDHFPTKAAARRAIVEFYRVVKADGHVAITIPNALFLPGTVSMKIRKLTVPCLEQRFTPKELRSLMIRAGLTPILYECGTPTHVGQAIISNNMPEFVAKIPKIFFNALMQIIVSVFSYIFNVDCFKIFGPRFGILGTKPSSHERNRKDTYRAYVTQSQFRC